MAELLHYIRKRTLIIILSGLYSPNFLVHSSQSLDNSSSSIYYILSGLVRVYVLRNKLRGEGGSQMLMFVDMGVDESITDYVDVGEVSKNLIHFGIYYKKKIN